MQHGTWQGEQIVDSWQHPARLLGKIGFLALVGFLVLVLAGPVVSFLLTLLSAALALTLAVVSIALAGVVVLLAFALVGWLASLPFRVLQGHMQVAWDNTNRCLPNFLGV